MFTMFGAGLPNPPKRGGGLAPWRKLFGSGRNVAATVPVPLFPPTSRSRKRGQAPSPQAVLRRGPSIEATEPVPDRVQKNSGPILSDRAAAIG